MVSQSWRRLWPLPKVSETIGASKSRIYALQRDGAFPPSIHAGTSARWLSDEIEAYRDFVIAHPGATDDDKRAFVANLVAERPTAQQAAA